MKRLFVFAVLTIAVWAADRAWILGKEVEIDPVTGVCFDMKNEVIRSTIVVKGLYVDNALSYNAVCKDGALDGLAKEFYKSGRIICKTPYKKGQPDGLQICYYESGKIEYEALYKNGKADGAIKEYFENGKLKFEIKYKNGKAQGDGRSYRADGKAHITIAYENGVATRGFCHTNGKKTVLAKDQIMQLIYEDKEGKTVCP